MLTSYNGWPASEDRHAVHLVPLVVDGVDYIPGVRGGDVHTVLEYVATQVSRRVERAVSPGCWGYNFRPDKNDASELSCHASATAIDHNAPKHPNGVHGTWSASEREEVHRILAEVDNVVRWGEDYTRTVDGMHFEIYASPAQVADVAARIRAGKVGPKRKLLGVDLSNVREEFLNARDGHQVHQLAGVKRIQRMLNLRYRAGLKVDGYAGEQTLNAYGHHEARTGTHGGPRIPDKTSLTALLKGSPYRVIA